MGNIISGLLNKIISLYILILIVFHFIRDWVMKATDSHFPLSWNLTIYIDIINPKPMLWLSYTVLTTWEKKEKTWPDSKHTRIGHLVKLTSSLRKALVRARCNQRAHGHSGGVANISSLGGRAKLNKKKISLPLLRSGFYERGARKKEKKRVQFHVCHTSCKQSMIYGRGFLALKLIKSYLRSSILQERLR